MLLPFALALVPLVASAHPNSVSSSRLIVDGARIELDLRCQARTLLEALPDIDADDDGELAQRDLDRARGLLEAYVREHHELGFDWSDARPAGATLALRLESARLASGELHGATPGEALVDLVLRGECPRAPENVVIDTRLFRESDAWHRDHAEIVWNGAAPLGRLMWVEEPRWAFAPSTAAAAHGVFGSYIALGVEHILTGYDHIAFVVALVVASRRLRALIGVVSAFTIAHSITLACAAFGVFNLPGHLVEPAIALSIAWVGARNLFARPPARLWPEAFGFGLIHGLGFAGAIADTLAAEPQKLAALVGFNLGVECGQLAVVVSLALVLASWKRGERAAPAESRTLAPVAVRRATSFLVCALGLWWFVARVWSA